MVEKNGRTERRYLDGEIGAKMRELIERTAGAGTAFVDLVAQPIYTIAPQSANLLDVIEPALHGPPESLRSALTGILAYYARTDHVETLRHALLAALQSYNPTTREEDSLRRGILEERPLPPDLSESLYFRLMYESPGGIGPFELVHESVTFAGQRLALYRVRW